MIIQSEQKINTDIIVDNIISNSNQSFLSPEIVFFNKPYTINKNSYYKMLVCLNLNPNMADLSQYKEKYNIANLDFKLYTSDLKEIKPVTAISKNYLIDNENKLFFEFEIPVALKQEHYINLTFGLSHDFNTLNYRSKGIIKINPKFVKKDDEININLVNYLTYYDIKNKNKMWTSECLLEANVNLKFNNLEVNKYYDEFSEININFAEKNQHLINHNQLLMYEIQQIKNNKIFPAVKLNDFKLNDEIQFKNYYAGNFEPKLLESLGVYKVVYLEKSLLDEKNKKVILNEGEKGLYFNPFNWSKKQSINLNLEVFGENLIFPIPIKSYSNFQLIDSLKFEIIKSNKFIYKFNSEFWNILILLTSDEIKEALKLYEVS
ncbi:hypothetical protein [Mesoplasma tabanidae]|uniref:Uncharacterized protein n=1 Tax=Mesoplasma tabanidae TaxID=219745 RepID=A0A2K8P559_9MOLU|nr:hypothetical protein [Mesoplasma tabanidae]ATZ21836.1 hypothetical protein MTABA_v1c06440 [Mesoplasma tabanidae]